VEQLRRLGVGRCVLQADGEPATRALVTDVIEEACASSELGVAGAHSPACDHRANGMVERAVREVKDQVRVMHCALSDKVGKVPSSNAVFDWLVIWAAEVLTGAQIGADGMTSYRRLRGRAWSPQIASFGEQVLARRARALVQGGLEPRWDPVTYLGSRWNSTEHYVSGADGLVYQVRAVRRVLEGQRWAAERVMEITGVPEDHARAGREGLPQAQAEAWPAAEEPEQPRRGVRGFHIRKEDMARHGYTRNCPRCDGYRTGRVTGTNHMEACRERFRKAFEEGGDGRVDRARQRIGDLPHGPVAADAMEEEQDGDPQPPVGPAPGGPVVAEAMEQELPAVVAPQQRQPDEMLVDMILRGASNAITPAEEVRRLCLIRGGTADEARNDIKALKARKKTIAAGKGSTCSLRPATASTWS
jgi:hypothetical protein